jgi:hypothetical protein
MWVPAAFTRVLNLLTYADLCCRVLTYADVWWTHDWAYAERMSIVWLHVCWTYGDYPQCSHECRRARNGSSLPPPTWVVTPIISPWILTSPSWAFLVAYVANVFYKEREREHMYFMERERERERERVVYTRTRSMYSSRKGSTQQRPLSCTCWESQRNPHLDIYSWAFLVL